MHSCSQIKSSCKGKLHIVSFGGMTVIQYLRDVFLGTLGVGWLAPYCGTPGRLVEPPCGARRGGVSPAIRLHLGSGSSHQFLPPIGFYLSCLRDFTLALS